MGGACEANAMLSYFSNPSFTIERINQSVNQPGAGLGVLESREGELWQSKNKGVGSISSERKLCHLVPK